MKTPYQLYAVFVHSSQSFLLIGGTCKALCLCRRCHAIHLGLARFVVVFCHTIFIHKSGCNLVQNWKHLYWQNSGKMHKTAGGWCFALGFFSVVHFPWHPTFIFNFVPVWFHIFLDARCEARTNHPGNERSNWPRGHGLNFFGAINPRDLELKIPTTAIWILI